MSEFKQIGTVEVLRRRTYPIDPETLDPGVAAVVEPGTYPLYSDGLSHFWVMEGRLNLGGVRRRGDGLITAIHGDMPVNITLRFPSRTLGEDEFADLLSHPVAQEGHADQRLRVVLG